MAYTTNTFDVLIEKTFQLKCSVLYQYDELSPHSGIGDNDTIESISFSITVYMNGVIKNTQFSCPILTKESIRDTVCSLLRMFSDFGYTDITENRELWNSTIDKLYRELNIKRPEDGLQSSHR